MDTDEENGQTWKSKFTKDIIPIEKETRTKRYKEDVKKGEKIKKWKRKWPRVKKHKQGPILRIKNCRFFNLQFQ